MASPPLGAMRRRTPAAAVDRHALGGAAAALLLAAASWLLAVQGWRSRPLAIDMLTYVENAEGLLRRGALPQYGDISSYGSFSPPGTSWLLAPGMLVFADPRLFEKVGSAGLHAGTLLGVFLLARAVFGARCAYAAVPLYGASALGLAFAGSLWPIGHPFFYVWTVYLALAWATRRRAGYLAAAVLTWAAGMYVDMAIAPALAILPAVWLSYRPPLPSRWWPVAIAIALALWFPYLQFEAGRGFADITSQLLRQPIRPAENQEKAGWCDASLAPLHWDGGPRPAAAEAARAPAPSAEPPRALPAGPPGWPRGLVVRGQTILAGLLANYREASPSAPVAVLLLIATLGALAAPTVRRLSSGLAARRRAAPGWPPASAGEGAGAGGAATGATGSAVLAIGLLVPWSILLLVAEPGRPERFFWLWPLQVIELAAFATVALPAFAAARPHSHRARIAAGASLALLVLALVCGPVRARAEAWLSDGWAGVEADEAQAARLIADDLRGRSRTAAAIGYDLFFYRFMADFHAVNRLYKVGVEIDALLERQHGVVNTNDCAEGVSPVDEYRVVQTAPKPEDGAPREYFAIPSDGRFRPLGQAGLYQVFRRD